MSLFFIAGVSNVSMPRGRGCLGIVYTANITTVMEFPPKPSLPLTFVPTTFDLIFSKIEVPLIPYSATAKTNAASRHTKVIHHLRQSRISLDRIEGERGNATNWKEAAC